MMVPSLAGESDGGDDLFFTEILILSKYSEEISAHAQRIKTFSVAMQKLCLLAFLNVFLFLIVEGRLTPKCVSISRCLMFK